MDKMFRRLFGKHARSAKWIVLALVISNEIRGIIVVATIGPPILKAIWHM